MYVADAMTIRSVLWIASTLQCGWIRILFVHLMGCPSAEAMVTSKKRGLRGMTHTIPESTRLVQDIHGTENGGCHRVITSENGDFFH